MKLFDTALKNKVIKVGARSSKLSIKQLEEVVEAMLYYYPDLCFNCRVCQTKGDQDLHSSLRQLEKSDFFTQELDEWVKTGQCQIAIHSAKDLPDPLPVGLEIVALTAPLDSEDVVVFHPDQKITDSTNPFVIATSSIAREQRIKAQWPNAIVVDLRGTIDQRLEQVMLKKVDAVVVAKVALIRLGYHHLNTVKLDGPTARYQGSLAVIAKRGDQEMKDLFQVIDSRKNKRILFTGLHKSHFLADGTVEYLPLIETTPLSWQKLEPFFSKLELASHLLVTSQTSVRLLFEFMDRMQVKDKVLEKIKMICVGQKTAKALQMRGDYPAYIAQEESQEGIIKLLNRIVFKKNDFLIYAKSAQSRPLIKEFLKQQPYTSEIFDLYDTSSIILKTKPDLSQFDKVVFTSPSVVRSFFENFGTFSEHLQAVCKGHVTQKTLNAYLEKFAKTPCRN